MAARWQKHQAACCKKEYLTTTRKNNRLVVYGGNEYGRLRWIYGKKRKAASAELVPEGWMTWFCLLLENGEVGILNGDLGRGK
jgi:hypothetical protein